MEKNTCAHLHGKKDLRIQLSHIPEPGEGEVQVKPAYVGVCGSDLHFYDDFGIEGIPLKPVVLGHETSGVVSKLGPGVTGLKVGDRVAVNPNQPCFKCRFCLEHRTELCEPLVSSGVSVDGGFANYMLTRADCCYKLDDHVTLEEAALSEPLSVAVWALQRGRITQGDTVVVFGMGSVGLLAFQAARAKGADKTLVMDVNPKRLELARSLGADIVHQVTGNDMEDPLHLAETLKKLLGCEADVIVECSGAPGTVDTALLIARKGGRVVMVGFGERKLNVHLGIAAPREVELMGCVMNNCNFPESMALLTSGKVKTAPLVSDKVPLSRILDAFELARNGQSVKVLVDCQP